MKAKDITEKLAKKRLPLPKHKLNDPNMPPKLPSNLLAYDASVCLLGNFIRAEGLLQLKQKNKLVELLGAIPDLDQAKVWKTNLKQNRSKLFGL